MEGGFPQRTRELFLARLAALILWLLAVLLVRCIEMSALAAQRLAAARAAAILVRHLATLW